MTRREMAKTIAARLGTWEYEGKVIVDTVLDVLTEEMVSGDRVCLRGFGTFKRRSKAGRTYPDLQNPGKPVYRPAHTTVVFKPGETLQGLLKERDEKDR